MSITVGDVLRVVATLVWIDGNLNQNVFNATIGGTGGPYDDADIVDDAKAWMTAIYTEILGNVSENLDGSQVQVYIYDAVDDDWDEVGSDSWSHSPTATADELPRGVAGLINAKTTDPDVSGKKYLGGLTEAAVTDGLWPAAIATVFTSLGDEWVGLFTGGTSGASWVPGVWSPTATNFYAFTGSLVIPLIPAYQRRRKRGVGV